MFQVYSIWKTQAILPHVVLSIWQHIIFFVLSATLEFHKHDSNIQIKAIDQNAQPWVRRSHKKYLFTLNRSLPLDRVIHSITCLFKHAIHSTFLYIFHEDIIKHTNSFSWFIDKLFQNIIWCVLNPCQCSID